MTAPVAVAILAAWRIWSRWTWFWKMYSGLRAMMSLSVR